MTAVIPFKCTKALLQHRLGVDVHNTIMNALDEFRKAVQPVGVYTVTAGVCVELGGDFRFFLVKAVLQQNPHKFVIHFLITVKTVLSSNDFSVILNRYISDVRCHHISLSAFSMSASIVAEVQSVKSGVL